MIIRIQKGSQATFLLLLLAVFSMGLLGIVKLPIDDNILPYLLWMVGAGLYLLYYRLDSGLSLRSRAFVTYYGIYTGIVQIIACLYSMIRYGQTPLDMYICAGSYLYLLLIPVVLAAFRKDGMEFVIFRLCILQLVYMVLLLVHSVVYNRTGVSLLAFSNSSARNGRLRIPLGAFSGIFFCYFSYLAMQRQHKAGPIVGIAIMLAASFYTEMTRAAQLAMLCTLLAMWLFRKDRSAMTALKFGVIVVVMVVFFYSSLYARLLEMFSTDYSVNRQANSTIARLGAIRYFSTYTSQNPLLGMGWVRPYTPYLTEIWAGPNHSAYFDDLGFLGQFFRLGVLGALIYLLLIGRFVYIVMQTRRGEYHLLLLGLLVYLVFTMPSLSCFDAQRILAVPFYIAIFESVYSRQLMGSEGS